MNQYKVLNINLSLVTKLKESNNELDEAEHNKFIDYNDLLKLQNNLYNTWEQAFEQQAIIKNKDPTIRHLNIKSLLVAFYSLFPPQRLEPMTLKIVNSEAEAEKHDNAIYFKIRANIWVYLNTTKKFHKPIRYNINDDVIRNFSENNVNKLIDQIIESVKLYPREYLFITTNKAYIEKSLQKMLSELVHNKRLGVHVFRSVYISHWIPKLNKNQINRVLFFMRSSTEMLTTNYFK